jgi:hypothetical protein
MQPHERRCEQRQRVLKEGKVLLTDHTSVDCVVRDLSPSGARIEFEGPIALPAEFRLRIVSADLTIPATAAWQRRLEAGLRFTGVGELGPIAAEPPTPRLRRGRQ